MDKQDWTLLVIAAADCAPLQPVQLQKALFLLGENVPRKVLGKNFYKFSAYDYGPFSSEIYEDAETLQSHDLVTISRSPTAHFKLYSATEAGKSRASQLKVSLSGGTQEYVSNLVRFVQSLSFNELVSSIYKHYPDMRVNSVFRG